MGHAAGQIVVVRETGQRLELVIRRLVERSSPRRRLIQAVVVTGSAGPSVAIKGNAEVDLRRGNAGSQEACYRRIPIVALVIRQRIVLRGEQWRGVVRMI